MIKEGDTIPHGELKYVPYTPELEDNLVCGVPQTYSTDQWKGKKVVLFAVPGVFTPTCHIYHAPNFIKKYDEFKSKGIDIVVALAANDHFVMSAWTRIEGFKDKIPGLSDTNLKWTSEMGLTLDLTGAGLGVRTNRFAMIIDDLKVVYLGVEPVPGVTVSSAEAVLAKL